MHAEVLTLSTAEYSSIWSIYRDKVKMGSKAGAQSNETYVL